MKALVVGGSAPQAALIKELKKRNFEVILADRNNKAMAVQYADKFYPVSTLDKDGIRNVAEKENVEFVITVCADQILLIVAQVCEELGLPCYLNYETAKKVSNKEYMKAVFVQNEIPTAKHIVLKKLNEDSLTTFEYPLIVKPVDAYSSRGVKKVTCKSELENAFNNAVEISRDKTAIIEEYIDGDELSVDVFVEDGKAKLLCVRVLDKIPDSDGFIICRGRYPANINEKETREIQEIAQKITDGFNLVNSPMLIQMKKNKKGMYVIEFCARTGGGIKYKLLPKVSGIDIVKAVVDLTLDQKIHITPQKYNKYIVDEFLYCIPGELDHVEGLQELLSEGIICDYDIYKLKGYIFGNASCSGDRVAYFSVEADSVKELREKHSIAAKRVKAISIEGKDLIRHEIIRFDSY